MLVEMLKSKILRAETTDARIDYEGSLAIDLDLMDKVGMLPYEKPCGQHLERQTFRDHTQYPPRAEAARSRCGGRRRTSETSETFS